MRCNESTERRHVLLIPVVVSRSLLAAGLLAAGLLAAGLSAGTARANPTTQSHETGWKAHGTIDGAQKQIELMYGKFAEWEKLAVSSTELMNAGRRFPHQQLSRIYPESYRGIWNAQHLQAMGEPAGYDLERKFTLLRNSLGAFAPRLGAFQAKEIAKLKKETPKRRQAIAKANELAGQGKLAEAERLIQTLHLRQLESIFYLTSSQLKPFENEINPPHREILSKLNAQRRVEYRERAKTKIASYTEAIKTLKSESSRVANDLSQSQTVKLEDGKTGDAADAIGYVRILWGNASVAIGRSVAMAWAFESGGSETIAVPFARDLDRAASIASDSIRTLLQAAARSTPSDQVAELLPKVLTELSLIDRRYVGRLDQGIADGVKSLAAKNPAVAEQSKRYSAAIVEPARWMSRYTQQQVKNLDRDYPPASNVLNKKLNPETSVRPAMYGRLTGRERVLTPGSVNVPASWVAGDAKMLEGMKLKTNASIRLSPAAKTAIVPQDARHFASFPAAFPIQPFLAELDDWLLLDDSHGPLDLAAASAKSSAELQEFENVGGRVTRLALEPAVSRFATLPDAAQGLVPLNSLPVIENAGSALEKVIWRVELQPDWVAHRFFFARETRTP